MGEMFRPTQFKIWYVHQMPCAAFEREVPDPRTGQLLLDTIYDLAIFQYEQGMIPDYANMGGIIYLDEYGEWSDYHPEDWEEYGPLGMCEWCEEAEQS